MSSESKDASPTLAEKKRQLLALMLDERRRDKEKADAERAIPRRGEGDTLVPSYAQQRLWFVERLEPGTAAYNIPAAIRLRGPLDLEVLRGVIDQIDRRHENLRTRFGEEDGQPLQVIDPPSPDGVDVPLVDLSDRNLDDAFEEAQRFVVDEAHRPFDLAAGPLYRTTLVRLAPDDVVIVLVIHHIIGDVWSIGLYFREMAALYEARVADRPSPLPELALQYADFAIWQRRYLTGANLERQLDFWRRQLTGAQTVLEIPTDRPRPPVQSFEGARCTMTLEPELAEGLVALGKRHDASMFMIVMAAYNVLLFRLTGQDDILVGTPMANRTRVELESLIGYFVNMLVVRTDLSGDPGFGELLARVKEATLGTFAHHDLPLERVMEELKLSRDMSRNPLYQAVLAFQNAPQPKLEAPGLALEPFEIEERSARFDLELDLRDSPEGYSGWIGYNRRLHDPETIERMVRQLKTLLADIVAHPERRISELRVLPGHERRQLLEEWSGRRVRVAATERGATICSLVAQRAAEAPEAVALVDATYGSQLTYGDLVARSLTIAGQLRRRGAVPDRPVAVLVERSFALVEALLGVLEAGAAYVHLDPELPLERLRFLVADSGARVVIAEPARKDLAAELASAGDLPVLELGSEPSEQIAADVAVAVDDDSLAYLSYTSGSTGEPKGVAVPHRAVVRLVAADERAAARLDRDETLLQLAPVAFDASTLEIWGALANGARLVIHPPGPPTLEDLGRVIRDHGVSTLWLTAGLFHRMVDERLEDLGRVRQLLAGGDVLSPSHVRRVLEAPGQTRVIDGYGPTENTTFTTVHPMDSGRDLASTVPIGRPVAGTSVYLLDRCFRPVPTGATGELLAGGDGLARGYLGRPAATAAAFVPDPFAVDRPGSRLYRTGDLARWIGTGAAGGTLEFVGRIDLQVKVRGFRIEPGEIEIALVEHPAVEKAVVTALAGPDGDRRLVAYTVAADPEAAPTVESLREFLGARLPDYMVPAAFLALDELPLNANGKVDRRALPAPDGSRPDLAAAYVAPRTEVETVLAQVWAEVLGVDRVGVEDDFFDLGGQSLLATQVVSRLRGALGVEVPLQLLFRQPTIASLAGDVEALRGGGSATGPAIEPVARETADQPMPLSFAQERLWFIDRLVPGTTAYNIPGAVRMEGPVDLTALQGAFDEILRRHEVLRSRFVAQRGLPVQRAVEGLRWPLRTVDLTVLPVAEREAQAMAIANAEAARPFDLASGRLGRLTLVRLAPERHLLVLIIHHIVYDMWSREVFIGELGALYDAFSRGAGSPLPEPPIQYADFAHWQRQWLQGEVLDEQLGYWRERLDGIEVLELPTDRPRPSVQSFRGERTYLDLPVDLSRRLERLTQEEGTTPFITLLAAFYVLLHRYTAQLDLAVGSPIANRNRMEVEPLMGFFANTLVMRTRIDPVMPFRQLLRQVREVATGAYAHQDLAFEKLVGEVEPERDLSRQPLFQILFNYLPNYVPPPMELPDLTLTLERIHGGGVPFDFTFSMYQADGALHGALDYSTDLFDPETVERMLGHYARLLESVVEAPERPLVELAWVPEEERRHVLGELTDGGPAHRPHQPGGAWRGVQSLFELQVDRTPEAVAVEAEGESLTYGELEAAANRLARHLRAAGVGPDERVALCLERSARVAVAVLATLKAGGAYVPLDPAYPEARLATMLEDSAPRVLVTEGELTDELPPAALEATEIVDLANPDTAAHLAGLDGARPATLAGEAVGESLAYVIYTSGSTGRPKGIAMQHAPLENLIRWHVAEGGGLAGGRRVLQFASLSFDASFHEMFAAWATGAAVVMVDEPRRRDAAALARYLADREIDRAVLPVVVLQQVAGHLAEDPETLDRLVLDELTTTGEQLQLTAETRRLLERLGDGSGLPLHNHYGPSETHVVTAHTLTGDPAGWPTLPPIGRPLGGASILLLDAHGEPVPVGVPGELHAGGEMVARGYLGRPALTAERFLPDPLAPTPGARVYRTGDLARWRADGTLDYLGRMDTQVKIRGFRIEPGEVEAVLDEAPGVAECAVGVHRATTGRRLVAYVVFADGNEPDPTALRAFLVRRLPDYMVPTVFVPLDALPTTPSGKLDRGSLPAPSDERAGAAAEYLDPRTETEEALVAVWSEVLGVERVGVRDNFFGLGGHSLLATQVVSRVEERFGVEIPLRDLFEVPTVEHLAATLDALAWAVDGAEPAGLEDGDELEEGVL